jgi:hydroxyacylglutathione hydrolase
MLTVEPIPAFNDNYIWMLQRQGTRRVVVVDPGQAEPVLKRLQDEQLELEAILVTHHHKDHVGGIQALLDFAPVPVYGPDNPAIENISQALKEGDTLSVLGEKFQVFEVPGHTLDHIAFLTTSAQQPLLFCGDSLFSAGCGRLFEGSAEQMFTSLAKYTHLQPETLVYPTHEYTVANISFAIAVEPDNLDLQEYQSWCIKQRAKNQPTLPTTIDREMAINPFLRSGESSVAKGIEKHFSMPIIDPVTTFRQTRLWKDHF